MSKKMNIYDALKNNNIEKVEMEIILANILKLSRANIIAHPEYVLSASQLEMFTQFMQRRENGEPIAYILNQKEFWSLLFCVDKNTLIPRPETELLIETMLECFQPDKKFHFLELGTGSGAIGITLATLFPNSLITAIDNSDKALSVAKKNQEKHKVENIDFIKSDWFSELEPLKKYHECFDAIISNPPYLACDDPHLFQGDLRYEPRSALIGGKKGTEEISKIVIESKKYLKKNNALLLIEHGYNQEVEVKNIFIYHQYECIIQRKDLNNLPRVTIGKLSGIKRMD
jgi:release factor glutamine methyltransferase